MYLLISPIAVADGVTFPAAFVLFSHQMTDG